MQRFAAYGVAQGAGARKIRSRQILFAQKPRSVSCRGAAQTASRIARTPAKEPSLFGIGPDAQRLQVGKSKGVAISPAFEQGVILSQAGVNKSAEGFFGIALSAPAAARAKSQHITGEMIAAQAAALSGLKRGGAALAPRPGRQRAPAAALG